MSAPLDPQVAELLSALLDGAVTDEEREVAAQWLERSPEARAEFESLGQVKAALGGLGAVEVPFGFYERMLRQGTPTPAVTSAFASPAVRRRPRWVAAGASVAATAAAWVAFAGTGVGGELVPPVAAVASGDVAVTALRAGGEPVRAFRQEVDAVRWDELPDGVRSVRGDAEVWRDLTTDGDDERIIVFEDGVVVTLSATDVEVDALVEAGRDLIEEEPAGRGPFDRLEDACDALVQSLSLGD